MGFFERENLDVEIVPWAFTTTGLLVEQGDADLGIAYPPDVLREVALGSSVKIVAAIIQENNGALVVPEESEFDTAQSLDDAETYGGYGTPHERPLVTEMLTAAGAETPGDFEVVVVPRHPRCPRRMQRGRGRGPWRGTQAEAIEARVVTWTDLSSHPSSSPLRPSANIGAQHHRARYNIRYHNSAAIGPRRSAATERVVLRPEREERWPRRPS